MEELNAVNKDTILKNIFIHSTQGDLIKRLSNLTNISEMVKKYHILPENTVPKYNIQKYLKGPI